MSEALDKKNNAPTWAAAAAFNSTAVATTVVGQAQDIVSLLEGDRDALEQDVVGVQDGPVEGFTDESLRNAFRSLALSADAAMVGASASDGSAASAEAGHAMARLGAERRDFTDSGRERADTDVSSMSMIGSKLKTLKFVALHHDDDGDDGGGGTYGVSTGGGGFGGRSVKPAALVSLRARALEHPVFKDRKLTDDDKELIYIRRIVGDNPKLGAFAFDIDVKTGHMYAIMATKGFENAVGFSEEYMLREEGAAMMVSFQAERARGKGIKNRGQKGRRRAQRRYRGTLISSHASSTYDPRPASLASNTGRNRPLVPR